MKTIAGTGEQGSWGGEGGAARETPLVSPWGLVVWRGLLFVAMAGVHQIWMIDTARGLAWPYAGTGAEARVDGAIAEAAFTQPSGLAIAGDTIYVADAEGNIVRRVDLPPKNTVTTLAGGNLFDFGDKDGTGDAVRLQHPQGIATDGERVYIADTYNHRIKVLDPVKRTVKTLAGTGKPGLADGRLDRAQFDEPGGLSLAGRTLYVTDANNHAVRAIDLDRGDRVDAPARVTLARRRYARCLSAMLALARRPTRVSRAGATSTRAATPRTWSVCAEATAHARVARSARAIARSTCSWCGPPPYPGAGLLAAGRMPRVDDVLGGFPSLGYGLVLADVVSLWGEQDPGGWIHTMVQVRIVDAASVLGPGTGPYGAGAGAVHVRGRHRAHRQRRWSAHPITSAPSRPLAAVSVHLRPGIRHPESLGRAGWAVDANGRVTGAVGDVRGRLWMRALIASGMHRRSSTG